MVWWTVVDTSGKGLIIGGQWSCGVVVKVDSGDEVDMW